MRSLTRGDHVTFDFDAETGVPQRFEYDGDTNTYDDELTIEWSYFRPLDRSRE